MYLAANGRPDTPPRPAGVRRRVPGTVIALGAVSLVTDVSSEMVTAVLPLYLVLGLGLSPLQFGFLDGLFNGATALVRLLGGRLADRGGRHKRVAGAGYLLSALSRLGLLIAGGAAGGIAAALAADRLGKGIRTAPRDALISLSGPPETLGRSFGVHRAMDTTGALLGPLVAFAVLWATADAYDAVFVVSFCVGLLGVLLLVLYVPGADGLPGGGGLLGGDGLPGGGIGSEASAVGSAAASVGSAAQAVGRVAASVELVAPAVGSVGSVAPAVGRAATTAVGSAAASVGFAPAVDRVAPAVESVARAVGSAVHAVGPPAASGDPSGGATEPTAHAVGSAAPAVGLPSATGGLLGGAVGPSAHAVGSAVHAVGPPAASGDPSGGATEPTAHAVGPAAPAVGLPGGAVGSHAGTMSLPVGAVGSPDSATPLKHRPLRDPAFRRILFAACLLGAATIGDAFLYLLLQRSLDLPPTLFPLLPLGAAAGYLLLAVPAGRIADRTGRRLPFLFGHVALLGAYAMLLAPVSRTTLVVVLALLGIFYAATDGVLMAFAGPLLPAHGRASGLAIVQTGQALARLVGAAGFGAAWTFWGQGPALWAAACALAGALAAAWCILPAPATTLPPTPVPPPAPRRPGPAPVPSGPPLPLASRSASPAPPPSSPTPEAS